jgi:hypothetical protein
MGRDDRAGTRPRDAGHVPFGVPKTDRRIAQARQLFDDDVVASAAAPMVSTCRLII